MSIIQPTIRRFPKTAETLADSNLPFSLVVTPMKAPSGKDGKYNLQQQAKLTHHNFPLLTSIPKCMTCGAPHPTKETHFWPYPYSMSQDAVPSFLVCYLCGGKTTNDQLPPPTPMPPVSDPHASVDRPVPQIFQVPLISTPDDTFWSLPAQICPPVIWFLLDGSCSQRSYWNTMSYVLLRILEDIPPHVHVGILLAATVPSSESDDAATTFSFVDLSSPVPHTLHFVQYAEDDDDEEAGHEGGDNTGSGGLLDKMSLVPADSLHLPNIHAAIRSLVDYDPSQLATNQRDYTMSMPLGKTIEAVLDYMDRGQHPCQAGTSTTASFVGEGDDAGDDRLFYAGGKIMTFLASCPTDLRGEDWRPLTRTSMPKTTVGFGGFGGAVLRTQPMAGEIAATNTEESGPATTSTRALDEEIGMGPNMNNDDDGMVETDMTPASLGDYYRAPEHVEAYFQELGAQCAESALGVDVFVLVEPHDGDGCPLSVGGSGSFDYDDNMELDVGLPFLRELADRSGAPGPLVFPLHQGPRTAIKNNPDIQRLRREMRARVPWGAYIGSSMTGEGNHATDGNPGVHHFMAFGGELRLRLSTSFEVDKSPVDTVEEGPQLAPLYSSGGIMGPASEEEEAGNLWRLGTCDPCTSLTIDLDMKDQKAQDTLNVEGMGEIVWRPVIQTCFAYTTIVEDPEHPGEYLAVRQMRIACTRVPLTDNVETLYSSIDPAVIATVLFHKLTLTLLRDGLSTAQTIGEDWLRSLLVCAYQSAEAQEEIQREEAEHGLTQKDSNGGSEEEQCNFYANERLLDREGELSAEDVLLAQGHERLKTLPLVVYSLLHCDAIRPSSSVRGKTASYSYLPTLDARCAAGAQMSSMNPPALQKCIAPHLQLWSCSQGLLLDKINLKMEAIRQAIDEFGCDAMTGKSMNDLVLLLDSPDSIVVCDASYVSNKPTTLKHGTTVGLALQKAICAAVSSYRTPPEVIYDLKGESMDRVNKKLGLSRLIASLVEDLPGNNGAGNFKEWGENLAGEIHDELEKDD